MFFVFMLVLLGVAISWPVRRYNALQTLAQAVREAHANVMASMKKRIDLANKLMDIARGYADHEKLTHISVAGSGDVISAGGAAAAGAVNQVMKLASQYPDLKANTAFQQLMAQLDQIEVDLQARRETYNAQVRTYNTALLRLPVSLFARQMGFRPAPYFDVENADSLEQLQSFHSDDADHLKELFAEGGRRLAHGSRVIAEGGMRVAGEGVRAGRVALEKGIEKGAELQKRHAAQRDGAAAADAPPVEPAPPQ